MVFLVEYPNVQNVKLLTVRTYAKHCTSGGWSAATSRARSCIIARGRPGREEGLGVLVRNLRRMRMVYWVNVSEGSGASLPVLTQVTGQLDSCCVVAVCKGQMDMLHMGVVL